VAQTAPVNAAVKPLSSVCGAPGARLLKHLLIQSPQSALTEPAALGDVLGFSFSGEGPNTELEPRGTTRRRPTFFRKTSIRFDEKVHSRRRRQPFVYPLLRRARG